MKSKNICRWCKKNGLLCMLLIILLICSFSPTIEGAQEKVSGEGGAANSPNSEGGAANAPAPNSGGKGGKVDKKRQGTAQKKKTQKQENAEQDAARDGTTVQPG